MQSTHLLPITLSGKELKEQAEVPKNAAGSTSTSLREWRYFLLIQGEEGVAFAGIGVTTYRYFPADIDTEEGLHLPL